MKTILSKLRSKAYWQSVYIITRKSLSEQYRNSFLGMLWSLIQPMANILVMSVVFSTIWRLPLSNYFAYLFPGLLSWQFMTGAISKAAGSINSRRGVFHHTALPKSMFVIADVLTQLYVFLVTFAIIYAIKLALSGFSPMNLVLPLVMLPLVVFTLSLAFVAAYVSAYIWDMPHVIAIAFMMLFWTVPIMYPIEIVPAYARVFFVHNPLYVLIHPIQLIISKGELPGLPLIGYAVAIAAAALLVAYAAFRKLHRNVIYYI